MTEIGSRQWNDSAEMSEWAFMAKVMREVRDLLPMNFSPLGVAIDIADARAKSGWRTVPDDDFAPDQTAEIARLRAALDRAAFVLSVMPDIALRVGLAGTSQWDEIAGGPDLFGALDQSRKALAVKS